MAYFQRKWIRLGVNAAYALPNRLFLLFSCCVIISWIQCRKKLLFWRYLKYSLIHQISYMMMMLFYSLSSGVIVVLCLLLIKTVTVYFIQGNLYSFQIPLIVFPTTLRTQVCLETIDAHKIVLFVENWIRATKANKGKWSLFSLAQNMFYLCKFPFLWMEKLQNGRQATCDQAKYRKCFITPTFPLLTYIKTNELLVWYHVIT